MRRLALTMVIGGIGAAAAWLIAFPAPFLTGPAATVSIACICGLKLHLPRRLIDIAMIMIGMSIGTSVSPEVVDAARQWPASFIVLGACLVVIMLTCSGFLRRRYGYDRNTAILTSAPGHLSYVLSLSADLDADIRTISIVQSIRVLLITLLAPLAVTALGGSGIVASQPLPEMAPVPMLFVFAGSIALGLVFQKLRVPAALLIGGMTLSTLTHLTGTVSGILPMWLQVPAFLIMGAMIGTRFSGVTLPMLKTSVWAGLNTTALACALSALFGATIALALDLPMAQVLMAFVPGGVEAMAAMAVLLGADPAFVAAHHVMRLFMLTALVPLLIGRKKAKKKP